MRAALVALLLALLGFGAALWPGRTLLPQDPRGFEPLRSAVDAEELREIDAATVPHRRDKLLQFLPYDQAVAEAWREGRTPTWEPRVLCGIPLVAQTTSRAYYPTVIAFVLFGPQAAYAWTWILQLTLAGLFAYRLARRIGASDAGALLGCASLVLSGYAVAHVHHPMIFAAALWTLPALECAWVLMRERPARPGLVAAGLAACTALSWFAGFSQASVLLGALVVALALASIPAALAQRRASSDGADEARSVDGASIGADTAARGLGARLAWTVAGLAIGTALAALQLLPALELAEHSARSTSASLDVLRGNTLSAYHLLEFLFPGQLAMPGDLTPLGPDGTRPSFLSLLLVPNEPARLKALTDGVFNHTETACAIGIWPLFFALAAMRRLFVRGDSARFALAFFAGVAAIGLAAAFGVPLIFDALARVPGLVVGDFRRMLMLPAIALPLLASLGFCQKAREHDAKQAVISKTTALVATVLGVGALIAGTWLLAMDEQSFATWASELLGARYGIEAKFALEQFVSGELVTNQQRLGIGLLCAGAALLLAGRGSRLISRYASSPTVAESRPALLVLPFALATAVELAPIAWAVGPRPARRHLSIPELEALRKDLANDTQRCATRPPRVLRVEKRPGALVADTRLLPPNLPLLFGLADAAGYAPLPPWRSEAFFKLLDARSASGGAGVGAIRDPNAAKSELSKLLATDLALANVRKLPGWTFVASSGKRAHWFRPTAARPFARVYATAMPVWRSELRRASMELIAKGPDEIDPADRKFFAPLLSESDAKSRQRLLVEFADGEAAPSLEQPKPAAGRASARLTRYAAGDFEVAVNTTDGGWLLVAEAWMPGWRAKITKKDGTSRTVVSRPGQLMFQSVRLQRGDQRVRFVYSPTSTWIASLVSLLAAIAFAGCVLRSRWRRTRAA